MLHLAHWILVLGYEKAAMPKTKVIAARTLKRLDQVYHSKQEKQKRKSEFLYRDNFVLP
jgi:hypothetical protein